MDAKINLILERIDGIESSLKAKEKWHKTLLSALEKILIPLAIASLAYFGHAAANKISDGQLKLSQSISERNRDEFSKTLQLKYMELAYADLTSEDKLRQKYAFAVISAMGPNESTGINIIASKLINVSDEHKAEIKKKTETRVSDILFAEFRACTLDENYSRTAWFNDARLQLIDRAPDRAKIIQFIYDNCNGRGETVKQDASRAASTLQKYLNG